MTQFNSEAITFPCRWYGSLLIYAGTAGYPDVVRDAFATLGLADSDVSPGNQSSGGKYQTWKVTAMVPDLDTLRALFAELEKLPGVRMLI